MASTTILNGFNKTDWQHLESSLQSKQKNGKVSETDVNNALATCLHIAKGSATMKQLDSSLFAPGTSSINFNTLQGIATFSGSGEQAKGDIDAFSDPHDPAAHAYNQLKSGEMVGGSSDTNYGNQSLR